MKMYMIVNKDYQDYDYMTEEYTQPLLIGNTYDRNGKFRYLVNGFFGFKTVKELLHAQKELERAQVIQFDPMTGLPMPLPKNTDRILEVEMLEHEGFTPCNLLGRSICMKIKVLREIHYNPDTFELINEPNE
jgi:hypothetical protein